MQDEVSFNITFQPPPPPRETPVQELKRRHTAPELRDKLRSKHLSSKGTKDDLV